MITYQEVYNLWAQWQYYEAAERGYDFKAAKIAQDKFNKAAQFYKAWYGTDWKNKN